MQVNILQHYFKNAKTTKPKISNNDDSLINFASNQNQNNLNYLPTVNSNDFMTNKILSPPDINFMQKKNNNYNTRNFNQNRHNKQMMGNQKSNPLMNRNPLSNKKYNQTYNQNMGNSNCISNTSNMSNMSRNNSNMSRNNSNNFRIQKKRNRNNLSTFNRQNRNKNNNININHQYLDPIEMQRQHQKMMNAGYQNNFNNSGMHMEADDQFMDMNSYPEMTLNLKTNGSDKINLFENRYIKNVSSLKNSSVLNNLVNTNTNTIKANSRYNQGQLHRQDVETPQFSRTTPGKFHPQIQYSQGNNFSNSRNANMVMRNQSNERYSSVGKGSKNRKKSSSNHPNSQKLGSQNSQNIHEISQNLNSHKSSSRQMLSMSPDMTNQRRSSLKVQKQRRSAGKSNNMNNIQNARMMQINNRSNSPLQSPIILQKHQERQNQRVPMLPINMQQEQNMFNTRQTIQGRHRSLNRNHKIIPNQPQFIFNNSLQNNQRIIHKTGRVSQPSNMNLANSRGSFHMSSREYSKKTGSLPKSVRFIDSVGNSVQLNNRSPMYLKSILKNCSPTPSYTVARNSRTPVRRISHHYQEYSNSPRISRVVTRTSQSRSNSRNLNNRISEINRNVSRISEINESSRINDSQIVRRVSIQYPSRKVITQLPPRMRVSYVEQRVSNNTRPSATSYKGKTILLNDSRISNSSRRVSGNQLIASSIRRIRNGGSRDSRNVKKINTIYSPTQKNSGGVTFTCKPQLKPIVIQKPIQEPTVTVRAKTPLPRSNFSIDDKKEIDVVIGDIKHKPFENMLAGNSLRKFGLTKATSSEIDDPIIRGPQYNKNAAKVISGLSQYTGTNNFGTDSKSQSFGVKKFLDQSKNTNKVAELEW